MVQIATISMREFEEAYARHSEMTAAEMHAWGREARPCVCGAKVCQGWQMVNARDWDEDLALHLRGEGPHPR